MADENPMTQPLSPVARNAKLVTLRSIARAILELTENGAPTLTDTDVNDLDNDLQEIGLKWFDELEPHYSHRLDSATDPTVNLDADMEGVDYTLATGIAQIAATLLSAQAIGCAILGSPFSPTDDIRIKAIQDAMIMQKLSYEAIQSTDDPVASTT